MKRFVFSLLIVSVSVSVLLTACKPEPHPVTLPDYEKANLTGAVQLFDEGNEEQNPDKMFVTIEGNEFRTYAETEKDGNFILRNVPFYDNYILAYIKDGYGTFKIYNYNHEFTGTEGVLPGVPKLGMKSTTCVTSLVVEQDTVRQDTSIRFNIGISYNATGTNPKYVRFLFHEINSVSDSTYSNYSPRITVKSNPASIDFTSSDFQTMGMQSGTTYFAIAYGDSFHTNEYFDFVTSKEVFPNLCAENAPSPVQIIVP
ncbi:MAG TPA: hypothetical protein VIN10_02455 [Bacteroidales bacterium]